MQNGVPQNKENRTVLSFKPPCSSRVCMKKLQSINDLLRRSDRRAGALLDAAAARQRTLAWVHAALPTALASVVLTAGIEGEVLVVGVAGGQWATRLRYAAEKLRLQVGAAAGVPLARVRVRVVPPG